MKVKTGCVLSTLDTRNILYISLKIMEIQMKLSKWQRDHKQGVAATIKDLQGKVADAAVQEYKYQHMPPKLKVNCPRPHLQFQTSSAMTA